MCQLFGRAIMKHLLPRREAALSPLAELKRRRGSSSCAIVVQGAAPVVARKASGASPDHKARERARARKLKGEQVTRLLLRPYALARASALRVFRDVSSIFFCPLIYPLFWPLVLGGGSLFCPRVFGRVVGGARATNELRARTLVRQLHGPFCRRRPKRLFAERRRNTLHLRRSNGKRGSYCAPRVSPALSRATVPRRLL